MRKYKKFEILFKKIKEPIFFGKKLQSVESVGIQIIQKFLSKNSKIANVSVGTGRILRLLRDNGFLNSKSIENLNLYKLSTEKVFKDKEL
ncbi:MAG: hypothetical protein QXD43_00175 [Candidatus Aenigmatarchaeota archaeon]